MGSTLTVSRCIELSARHRLLKVRMHAQQNTSTPVRLIRSAELFSKPGKLGLIPISRATAWRWIHAGKFPRPISYGPRCSAWPADVINAWMEERASASVEVRHA